MDDSEKQQKPVHHKRKRSSRKKLLIVFFVLVIIVGAGVGGWVIYDQNLWPMQKPKTIQEIDSEAQNLYDDGNLDGSVAAYDSAIEKATDSEEKVYLLLGKASVYFNDDDFNQAIIIAKQAELINDSDEDVTKFLASSYAAIGDNQKAIEYYQKTIILVEKSSPLDNHSDFYRGEIELLESENK